MPAPLITRTPIINDDGSMTVGTVWDQAWKTEFYNQIDAVIGASINQSGVNRVTQVATAGTIDNLALADMSGPNTVLLMSNTTTTITGIAGGRAGLRVTFIATGTTVGLFPHTSASSLPVNRLANIATTAPTPIYSGGYITYEYVAAFALWILVDHDQGSWLTAPFNAANFTGGAPLVWTVAAGNVYTCAYKLDGRTMEIGFYISGATLSGSPSQAIAIGNGAYGGFISQRQMLVLSFMWSDAGGVNQPGFIQTGPGQNTIGMNKTGGANFAIGPSSAYGSFRFEVT